jgi:hypothetical protein
LKTILLRYTVPVEVDVPDDFPVSESEIERVADWRRNDCSDGRHDFTTEQMHQAVLDAAKSDVNRAVSSHYCERIRRHFPANPNEHYEACSALTNRCLKKVEEGLMHLVDGGTVEISVTTHPLPPERRHSYQAHIVVCRDDTQEDGTPGPYQMATRTVFAGLEAAQAYAGTIASARAPLCVPISLSELRVGEDRGRLEYWVKPKSA